MIDFNVPPYIGTEMEYVRQSAEDNHKICGDGPFTKRCQSWLEERFCADKVLLTTSERRRSRWPPCFAILSRETK